MKAKAFRILGESARALARSSGEKEFLEKVCKILVREGSFRKAWVGLTQGGKGEGLMTAAVVEAESGPPLQSRALHGGPAGSADRTRPVDLTRPTGPTHLSGQTGQTDRMDLTDPTDPASPGALALALLALSKGVPVGERVAAPSRGKHSGVGGGRGVRGAGGEGSDEKPGTERIAVPLVNGHAAAGVLILEQEGNSREPANTTDHPSTKIPGRIQGGEPFTPEDQAWMEELGQTIACGVASFRGRAAEVPPQDALDPTREEFQLIVGSVQDYAIFRLDPEGKVTTWNTGAEHIKGYRAQEILGRHFSCFYLPEDREGGKPEVSLDLARSEGRFEDEGWRVRKDGSRFWANAVITALRDAEGTLQGFVKVTRDMTDRMRAEKALREREERYRIVVRAISEAIYDWDLKTRSIWWSAGVRSLFGYPLDNGESDVEMRNECIHPDDRNEVVAGLQEVLEGRKRVWSAEYRFRRSDGSYAWIFDRGMVLEDENRRPVRLIGALQDVTETRRAREEIASLKESLRKSGRHRRPTA